MLKKPQLTRGCLSFWFNSKQSPTRWSLSRPPKLVSIEINKSVGQSNIQWRGWSYAVHGSSDKPNTLKGRKRVSREERRAIVESFVKKYREMNAGKFPTISDTIKQVGGGYYVVRKIVQELEYKSKMKSSNIMSENLAEKELFNKSKALTENMPVSSGKTETTIDGHVQDDPQLVDLDYKDFVNAGYEEKRMPQSSRSLSDEAVTATISSSHFITAEGNHMARDEEEPSLSSLEMMNDVMTVEAESSYSDSVAERSHLLTEQIEHSAAPFTEKSGSAHGKAQNHGSEYVDMEMVADETFKLNLEMPNVKTEEAASSYSNSFASESHLLTQELEQISVPFSEKSGTSNHEVQSHDPEFVHMQSDTQEPSQLGLQISNEVKARSDLLAEELEHIPAPFSVKSDGGLGKAQNHNYEFVDAENHPATDEKFTKKAEYVRREQAALEGLPGSPKHEMEHSQGSSVLDGNKSDNSNNEDGDMIVPEKLTFWGNLKSFADGVVKFWRKS